MTPTTRDSAIAQAIAALEPFAEIPLRGELEDEDYTVQTRHLRQARYALASLRSLAPAPADTMKFYWLIERRVDPPQYATSDSHTPGWTLYPLRAYRYATKDEAEEVVRFLPDDIRKDAAVTQHGFMERPAPADQSDAGRDRVIEEEMRRLLDHFESWARDHSGDATPETWAIIHCSRAALSRRHPRALTAAPAETVRRGEADKLRDFCFKIFMHVKNGLNPDDGGPVDWMNDTLPMVNEWIARRTGALPAADREAIREALKEADRRLTKWIRNAGGSNMDVATETDFLNAALALIWEG